MVFEAVVVELLNKFLKQYVENLDTSQLKIGIWGGDVVLNDLRIKTTVFDDLNLPIRVKWGKLGKLAMKIPWKNLYSSQVVVDIAELLIILIPNNEFKYDPVKEEKWEYEKKQARLKAVEEARKRETDIDVSKQSDGFIEKLISQIVKNIQVIIRNIHIRYEDKSTNPSFPFSVGITMSSLSAKTSLSDPNSAQESNMGIEKSNIICKVVHLEGLAIYWNPGSVLFSELDNKALTLALLDSIPNFDYRPKDYLYVFGPLSANASLKLNPKPENDGSNFTIPKIFISVHLQEIDLAVTHEQFCDILLFAQDYQRLAAASIYRKYRPVGIPVIGHAKEWWHFAYNGVVKDIRRRKLEWSWENIKNHRQMCRKYYELYELKLNSKKIPATVTEEMCQLEKKLNVFNLLLLREQAYVHLERSNLKKEQEKEKESKSSGGGWFSGWFGSGNEAKPSSSENELVKKIESVMTTQEKEKLYKAIGYDESSPPPNYPPEFIEFQFRILINEIRVTIFDDHSMPLLAVISLSIKTVKMDFEQRPAAFAMKFAMVIGNFQILGKQEESSKKFPELVTTTCDESESLIEILYETKPLNASCDQRVHINARPLRIIYHAETINRVRAVFDTGTPEDVSRIVSMSSAHLPAFQKITAMGLQYAIEKRTVLEVKVNIMPSYLIIPYGGSYRVDKEMLVIMFGRLNIETENSDQKDVSIKKLYLEGTSEQEIFSTVLSASYTNFKCELTGVQILFQLIGEDWVQASNMLGKSSMRFLESTDLVVTIKKSLVTDDPRIPKIICEGQLPSLELNFSEERLIAFAALLCSIPTKEDYSKTSVKKATSLSAWSLQSLGIQLENKLTSKPKEFSSSSQIDYVQGIDFVVHFEMNELIINVSKTKDINKLKYNNDVEVQKMDEKFLMLRVVKLEVELTKKTFETINLHKLGGIELNQYHRNHVLPFVTTKGLQHDYYLFVVEYINADTMAPDFYTVRGAIVNRLTLNVTPLNVVLNKEALLAEIAFFARLQARLDKVKQNCRGYRMADAGKLKEVICEESAEGLQTDKKLIPKGKKFRKKLPKKEIIDFFLDAHLEEINVLVEFEGQGLTEFSIKGGSVEISTRKSFTNLDFKLKEILLSDLNPQTLHKKIVESLEKQTLCSRITIFNSEYFGSDASVDMSIEAEVGGLRCFFLNLFFSRVFAFLSAFQVQIQTLKEGAAVAAQRAKKNVIKAYQNTSKICVNVKMTAPLLIIPRKCSSLEILLVDLGVLTIKNNITELNYALENDSANRPLIDSMRFHLQNLKFSRCILCSNMTAMENEKTFLIPVSFELTIKRNLSTAWFKVIPEFEVLARLASVHVRLTHNDLCNIAAIFHDNASETAGNLPKSSYRLDAKTAQKLKEPEDSYLNVAISETDEEASCDSSSFYTVVKYMFYMDSLIFDAITEPDKKDGFFGEEGNVGLARLTFETISLKGRKFSNGSVDTSVMLVSCLLNDTRPGKEGRLTRFLGRTEINDSYQDEPNSMKSMIEVLYKKKDCDAFVDVRVYKFTLILSMDFLHKLREFFTLEDAHKNSDIETVESPKATKTSDSKLKSLMEEDYTERLPTFTVNLRLEKPDIIIVQNMDSIDTDALIFHTEIVMKYRFAGIRQVISGTLSDIELYSCCFNPLKRRHTLSQVIKPFTISVAGSTPLDQGLHVDICLTEILVNIHPGTVELISKCYEALITDSSVNEKDLLQKDYSSLWDIQSFSADEYWFLKAEQAEDALTSISSDASSDSLIQRNVLEEICLIAIPSIVVMVEGLAAKQIKPLLLLQMGFQLQCFNWSSKLSINSSLSLQLQYYNKKITSWEPLIEPVEIQEDRERKIKHSYTPWELTCSIALGDDGYLEAVEPPKMSVSISCSETLPITLTKTSLEVLKTTIDTYTSAVTKGFVNKVDDLPPFIVKNETGLMVELLLVESNLKICKAISDEYEIVKLESNSEVELQIKSAKMIDVKTACSLDKKKGLQLNVKFPISKSSVFELPLSFASKRYYPIPLGEFNVGEVWGLISEVSIKDNTTVLVLRSVLKIINYFNEPINIHSLTESAMEAEHVGIVEGNSAFSLPFHAVYNSSKKLFFSIKGYYLSNHPFTWENIKKESTTSMLLQCNTRTPEDNDPFFIQAIGEVEEIYFANTNRKTSSSICFSIHLQPTVKIVNSLPVDLIICFQGSAKEKYLHPGNNLQITNAEPGNSSLTLRINDYLEKEWSSKEAILENPPEYNIWKFVSYNGLSPETLNLGVHCTFSRKTAVYTIYCPYFMVNKTDHLLSYRFDGSHTVFYHPKDFKAPVMFSPTYRKFFSKKSAYLKINHSEWSEKFPVDVAGSGGTVECEDATSNIPYKVSVSITLTFNSLTKIVMFTPFYVFINETQYLIECAECDFSDHPWLEIPPDSCTPFWPRSRAKTKTIQVRPKDTNAVSPPFAYSSTDTCLLRLKHKFGGIFVNVQATQSGTYITFNAYEEGQAPALIINHSAKSIKLFEMDTDFSFTLKPSQKIMHTWMSPTGRRKLTLMNPKHLKDEILLDQDAREQVFTSKGESVKYVTFLDGTQRVLLFTDDLSLSSSISNFLKMSYSGIEVICQIQGIGVSLVNNVNSTEILYMGFISSGIVWETRKIGKSRYKRMKQDDMYLLEEAYNKYQQDTDVKTDVNPIVSITEKTKVDFNTMRMIHPQVRELKRTFEPGLWLAYRLMEDQIMINLKANKIQIDNQLHDCIFPVILSPVPPPKSVAALYQGVKPFIELSIVKKTADKSGVEQYKYFEILVQEFQVKIDIGFLQQFWSFLAPEEISDEEQKNHFLKDLECTEKPLISHIEIVSSNEQKNFYEFLHFSPLKIHFSFSLAGNIDNRSLPPAVSVLIQSVGVTLTDVHDVIFRLSYFERKCVFLTQRQLHSEVVSHYFGQTVRQAYVLLLGLDVIGNPFGLIVGIGEGVEAFFYEPIQGIVHGPSEFATGVAIGCKSLFGRTVGSTAGTLGKLTETLGKGLAVLSLDKEYQLQRMEHQNRQENIQASMARGGRGLVMGVFEGVTGIVKKPIEGAKEEGVGGFFKGMGKGMMGLVTRPVTGVVDFASTSLNAVKRATGPSFENKRQRPPRFFRDDLLVQPYNLYEALGSCIFHSICRRKYCSTDKYEHHIPLRDKEIVIFTNKRMILAELNELFGTWQEHMAITWKSMPERPHCHAKGVAIMLPSKGISKKEKVETKVLLIPQKEVKEEVCKKMVELYKLEREALS